MVIVTTLVMLMVTFMVIVTPSVRDLDSTMVKGKKITVTVILIATCICIAASKDIRHNNGQMYKVIVIVIFIVIDIAIFTA